MFVRKSEFYDVIATILTHSEADCEEIAELGDIVSALWDAVTALEAVVYADQAKPVKAVKKAPPVATSTRTKKA